MLIEYHQYPAKVGVSSVVAGVGLHRLLIGIHRLGIMFQRCKRVTHIEIEIACMKGCCHWNSGLIAIKGLLMHSFFSVDRSQIAKGIELMHEVGLVWHSRHGQDLLIHSHGLFRSAQAVERSSIINIGPTHVGRFLHGISP